jgi:hypothetical protein
MHANMGTSAPRWGDRGWRLHSRSSKVVAQSFEHGRAQQSIIGDGAVFDFRINFRLDPGSLRQDEVRREMHRYKRGRAKSGRGGKGGKVKSRKQAIAIGLSKARKKGKKVPRKKR